MTLWSDATVEANGISIHYWRSGGNKPPLLLAHGLTDNGRCWESVAPELAANYDLIAPDSRGHGLTSAPESGYSVEERARDLVALLDVLELPSVFALGHSMGGDVVASLAAIAPTRVRAALLEDPALNVPSGQEVFERFSAGSRADQALGKAGLLKRARTDLKHWDPACIDAWAESKMQVNQRCFQWVLERQNNWRETIAAIRSPMLLITGEPERGAIVTPAFAEELTQLCPTCEVAHVADVGHCIRYEQPTTYLRIVREYLDRIAR